MIVLSFNGFSNAATCHDIYFGMNGIDRNRVIGHDAAAALFIDGKLIAAAEEERFSRVKKTSAFPENAIEFCLKQANVTLHDIDIIAFPWDISEDIFTDMLTGVLSQSISLAKKLEVSDKLKSLYYHLFSHDCIIQDFNCHMKTDFTADQFSFVPHHFAHALTGFLVSGMHKSAILVTDGRGETSSAIMGEISKKSFNVLDESIISISNSIGLLYRKFTRYLGFMPNNDEYKVMALGTFAKSPSVYDVDKFMELLPHGQIKLKIPGYTGSGDDIYYYRFFDDYFGSKSEKRDYAMAYFVQHMAEMAISHQINYLQEKTDADILLMEGGVALNCVNNSKILVNSRFKNVYVSFSASDSGTVIGAGLYPFYQQKIFDKTPITPYLGPSFEEDEILTALNSKAEQIEFSRLDWNDLCDEVTAHLINKKIIGWFQDRMEFGPRALGNRSILANPAFPDMKDIINAKVKYREAFRPFAGVILDTEADNYFEMGKKKNTPFMTFVFKAKPEAYDKLPGAVHVDNTSRLQTVIAKQNPKLHGLIANFFKKTGLPCLINTSFNVQGEPVVCKPLDAINCFLNSGIDILVVENYLVTKK
ncbi:MAG: carbamoyltransferase [Candidatus Electrothrix sp. GM3_4]|nr:carbamoyltransferase [Candidatus Electrothrix sp. GM3_4]